MKRDNTTKERTKTKRKEKGIMHMIKFNVKVDIIVPYNKLQE